MKHFTPIHSLIILFQPVANVADRHIDPLRKRAATCLQMLNSQESNPVSLWRLSRHSAEPSPLVLIGTVCQQSHRETLERMVPLIEILSSPKDKQPCTAAAAPCGWTDSLNLNYCQSSTWRPSSTYCTWRNVGEPLSSPSTAKCSHLTWWRF